MRVLDQSFSLHKSATVMLEKSNRKCNDNKRNNARSITSHRTDHNEIDSQYLTDHAFDIVTKHRELHNSIGVKHF